MLDEKLDAAFKELIEQWNIAERRIKAAEQVRANEVVASAIFELRYAGRKVTDALTLILKQDWHNPETYEKIHAYIADATEDCVKAKHDAIDAIIDFVTTWFYRIELSLGLAAVQQFFPTYIAIRTIIADIQDRISESRGDRTISRDAIYNEIEEKYLPDILALYRQMQFSNPAVSAAARKDRRERRFLVCTAGIAILLAIVGIAIGMM